MESRPAEALKAGFLVKPPPAPDHTTGLVAALRRACVAALD
jgi:hypothetical protein